MLPRPGELKSFSDALPSVSPHAIHHTLQMPFQAKYHTHLRFLFVCPPDAAAPTLCQNTPAHQQQEARGKNFLEDTLFSGKRKTMATRNYKYSLA